MIGQHVRRMRLTAKRLLAAAAIGSCFLFLMQTSAPAWEILGTGTGSLLGSDLTDPDNNGDPEFDIGYDAIFDASDEPGFGGGEFAFNVFDNRLGPSNDKWCCGVPGGISEDDPQWVSAQLPAPHFLTSFTISSANDVEARDPIYWALQGSNDGENYTDIYLYEEGIAPWDARLQVIHWTAGDDFPVQTTSYEYFRMATYETGSSATDPNGAYFQIGEIELFGTPDGEVPPIFIGGEGTIGIQAFDGNRSNESFGPEQPGVPGWSARIVTYDEHLMTVDSHTVAEIVLEDYDGVARAEAYPVVDMAGGTGSFTTNLPYPNGVTDTSQEDFVVQVVADVVIPEGTWTVGFGSDDGGQITISGVEFELWTDDGGATTAPEIDQIRYEGNRGHNWSVGSFTLNEPLETTIVSSFHERGGGDSYEIAVIEGEVIEAANPANGWELLGDGTLGWSVTTTATPLLSADLSAAVSDARAWEFDVNGDTDAADQLAVVNPDPNVYTTVLDVDGVTFQIAGTGSLANGDSFQIIDADQITGTPIITSRDPGQTWTFDSSTGFITFGAGLRGDFNGNGAIDLEDIDILAEQSAAGTNLAEYDLTGDGLVNQADVTEWAKAKDIGYTWIGDSNYDGQFNTADFVKVLGVGKYEAPNTTAKWSEGDWTGDGVFGTGDLVAALSDGGFELGPRTDVAAVPEPSAIFLSLLGLFGLLGLARRR